MIKSQLHNHSLVTYHPEAWARVVSILHILLRTHDMFGEDYFSQDTKEFIIQDVLKILNYFTCFIYALQS